MVNTNLVYKTVLYILNKEQRGYMTPAEFEAVATQVQLEIFEKYFEDLNQQLRVPGNDSEYGDRVKSIRERIQIFETEDTLAATPSGGFAAPSNLHRVGVLEYVAGQTGQTYPVEEVTRKEYADLNLCNLTSFSSGQSIGSVSNIYYYYMRNNVFITFPFVPSQNDSYVLQYVRKPVSPTWPYAVGNLGQYVPSTGGQNFELSSVEQTEIILRILSYAGIIIRDPQIIQTAAQMAGAEDANEKS